MTHVSRAVLTVTAELKGCATQTSFTRLTANKCEAVAAPRRRWSLIAMKMMAKWRLWHEISIQIQSLFFLICVFLVRWWYSKCNFHEEVDYVS